MGVSKMHIFEQGAMLKTLLKTAAGSLGLTKPTKTAVSDGPQPVIEKTVTGPSPELVRDFIKHLSGDPGPWKKRIPPHLFPQWGMPVLAETLDGLPYDFKRILNGGCSFEVNQPLPAGVPLHLRAQLSEIDDDGYRAIFTQKLFTGTDEYPDALVSAVTAVLPLKKKEGAAKKAKPRIPNDARQIDFWKLSDRAGLDFALVTGDFNPVHLIRSYARISGFPNTINHGFGTFARAVESLTRGLFSGRADRLKKIEARFVRPLVLPAKVGVYVTDQSELFVGKGLGGPAVMTAKFETKKENDHE